MLGNHEGETDSVGQSLCFFSSRRRHTRFDCDWSSDVCSSDLEERDEPLERPPVGFNAAGCFTSLAKLVRSELLQERKEYARTFVVGLVAELPPAPRDRKSVV